MCGSTTFHESLMGKQSSGGETRKHPLRRQQQQRRIVKASQQLRWLNEEKEGRSTTMTKSMSSWSLATDVTESLSPSSSETSFDASGFPEVGGPLVVEEAFASFSISLETKSAPSLKRGWGSLKSRQSYHCLTALAESDESVASNSAKRRRHSFDTTDPTRESVAEASTPPSSDDGEWGFFVDTLDR